ncbi:MAG: hypothetical protein R6U95_06960, partial [Bacteroidales bacterium]
KIQWIGLNFYPEQKQRICEVFSGIPVHQVFTDRIPQKDVISLLYQSSVLLLPASDIKKQVYAKVFDYLQVQRRIFLFPSDNGTLQEIIDNTSSGLSFAHAEDLHKGLMNAFGEWKQNGFVESQTHTIEQYSRKNQARKFAQILLDKN